MNLILIRHGDVEYPKDADGFDLVYDGTAPLAPHGFDQLRDLGTEFVHKKISIDAVFVSPYVRAHQSADALLERVVVPHRFVLHELRDVDPNSWIGSRLVDYATIGGDIYNHPKPGKEHESLIQEARRMQRALQEMYARALREGYKTIAAVSHGDPLSALGWMMRHGEPPTDYSEMKHEFYPDKGEAIGFTVDDDLRVTSEGQVYRPESVNLGIRWNR